MAEKKVIGKTNSNVFIAKSWYNDLKNLPSFNFDGFSPEQTKAIKAYYETGRYLTLSFDQDVKVSFEKDGTQYSFEKGAKLFGFPNSKRDGKRDADTRWSFPDKAE